MPIEVTAKYLEYSAELVKLNACQPAIAWLFSKKYATWEDVANAFEMDKEPEQAWFVWLIQEFQESMPVGLRIKFAVVLKNPMTAFRLYVDYTFWTPAEEAFLQSKFEGKLPRAERELMEGVITRGI